MDMFRISVECREKAGPKGSLSAEAIFNAQKSADMPQCLYGFYIIEGHGNPCNKFGGGKRSKAQYDAEVGASGLKFRRCY